MFIYAVTRNSLTTVHAAIQGGHAITEAVSAWTLRRGLEISPEACLGYLTATKSQLKELRARLDAACVAYKAIVETAGPLAGVTTAIGVVTEDKALLVAAVPLLDTLPKLK